MVMEGILPESFGKVAVLMGGRSAERAISLESGQAVLKALQAMGVNAEGLDVTPELLSELTLGSFDRAFIALHGRGGEDGTIQGALESIGLPYTGSGVLASALAMDKWRSKQIWQALGLPTPAAFCVSDSQQLMERADQLGFPLVVKPIHEGSSIGITIVKNKVDLQKAFEAAHVFDTEVMLEAYIAGEEYTIGILQEEAMPVIRVQVARGFYDYEAKYQLDSTQYLCPCGLNKPEENKLKQLALQAFSALGCRGWGRVDVMAGSDGRFWLLEVNTIPGLTSHSLVPKAALTLGIPFNELVLRILSQTLG